MYRGGLQQGLELHHFPRSTQLQNIQQRAQDEQQRPIRVNVRDSAIAENEEDEEVVRFMRRCYMTAGLFIVVTAWQWMILSFVLKSEGDYLMGGFICLTFAFAVLIVLTICMQFRRNFVFSCILGWLFVETAAMGIVLMMPRRSLEHICLAMLAALAILVFCYFLGAWLPMKILPGEITIFLFLIIFIVTSILLLTLYIVTDQPKYKTLYFALLAIVLMPTSVYHSQVIHGRRFFVPFKEYVNFAVSVYVNFLMFFASIYYGLWVRQW